jgi:hypothetical protein
MPAISIKAHYDGSSIQLDEPYELPPHAQLLVTVLPTNTEDVDLLGWHELGAESLARAYGDDETEYSLADIFPAE